MDRKRPAGQAWYAPFDHRWTRGGTPASFGGADGIEQVHVRARLGMALVLWEDCEIDKFAEKDPNEAEWFTAVVPILSGETFPEEVWAGVEAGARLQFFFLPAAEGVPLPPRAFADLRFIWPVRQALLRDRVATLSDANRDALYSQLFSFLTHRRLGPCPRCGHPIATSELAPTSDRPVEG